MTRKPDFHPPRTGSGKRVSRAVDQATTLLSAMGEKTRMTELGHVRRPIPALTIVYHPDLHRVGERALLTELIAGRPAKISRTMPRFSRCHGDVGTALETSYLSRSPFVLRRSDDGTVTLDPSHTRTPIAVDGALATEVIDLTAENLERGVFFELAGHVALLLHLDIPEDRADADDLGLLGNSRGIRRVRDDIRKVAAIDIPVLIRGETGSGKELVANAIHRNSPRHGRPLVSVNLAALPSSLAASELFGVVRGAYTGAARNQEGYFRRASGGTLFLDEIGEIPIDVQAMLLRALETREIFPLGAQRPEKVDVRVIAATDADLETLIRKGKFRAPLLHRLAGYEVHVPALRERRDDIALLLLRFLARELAEFAASHRLHQLEPGPWLSMAAVMRFLHHQWPGNVRQLRNAARQFAIRNHARDVAELPLETSRLSSPSAAYIDTDGPGDRSDKSPDDPETLPAEPYRKPSDLAEAELIETLRAHDWDIKATASALQISRTSLYSLIRASDNVWTAGDLSGEEIRTCFAELDGDLEAMVHRLCVSRNALRRRIKELKLA